MTPAGIRRDGWWRRGISRGARAPISSHRAWCLPCIASYAIMISFRRNSSSTSMDDLRRRFAYNGSMRRTRESARTLLDEAKLSASIARTPDEVRAAQRLRHRVFAEEMQARLETTEEGLDADVYDPHCEHLLVRRSDPGGGGDLPHPARRPCAESRRVLLRDRVRPGRGGGTARVGRDRSCLRPSRLPERRRDPPPLGG